MPRDASGTYRRPPGTDAVADHTIESTRYNDNVIDVETDLNRERPIVAGGTGANNAVDAMTNLGGEIAYQAVDNYNFFQFKAGSFFSAPGATAAPVADWCEGICYMSAPGATDFFIEARALNSSVKYVRRKLGGVWGSWVLDQQAVIDSKVARAGDTMTGNLTLTVASPNIVLNKSASGQDASIWGDNNGLRRWQLSLGNTQPESGGAGSDFALYRYNDAGTFIDGALGVSRLEGRVYGNGVVPTSPVELTNKAYVDSKFASVDLSSRVAKAGDTMTGQLTLPTGPGAANAVRKDYVDAGDALRVAKSGDTMTGGLVSTAFESSTGNFYSKATAGNNCFYTLYDVNVFKGHLAWDRSNNSVNLYNATSNTNLMVLPNGLVITANGLSGKAGTAGAFDTNGHNFFWTGSVAQVWIDTTNVGNISITCDYRIKKDVRPLGSTWELVKLLSPIAYTQREYTPPGADGPLFVNDDTVRWGFLAHELQDTLLPSAATGTKDSPTEIQSPDLLAVIAGLTRCLQEAMARIEQLEIHAARRRA